MIDFKLAGKIDHTLLKPNASKEDILKVCDIAKEYHTASVCVNSCWTSTVRKALEGSQVKTCVVVGFPLGAMSTAAKAFETAEAVRDGAQEIDMVINVGWAKAGQWKDVEVDIAAVVKAADQAVVKVIIETCLLTDVEKVQACLTAKSAGADFVKTSTGFSTAGATVEDIKLMKKTVGDTMKVKAAGGIRNRETALAMIEAGADRIGASSTASIVSDNL